MSVRKPATLFGVILGLGAAGIAAPPALAASGLIAYSDGGGSLYVATAQGTSAKTLYESDSSTTMEALDVSPDGKQVLAIEYGDQRQLVLVPVAGGAPVPVAGADGAGSGSFSPDGTKLVFSLDEYASDTLSAGIYTVSVAGGTPKPVTATPSGGSDSLPKYSPDGTTLAFVRDTYDDDHGNETVSLELMPSSGGSLKALATGLAPDLGSGGRLSFSPDGTKIAFVGDSSNPGIFTVPVAGGDPTQLTSDFDYWPSFMTDGSKLYFSRDATSANADDNAATPVAPADNNLYELWTVKKDGSGETMVAKGDFEYLALAALATSGGSSSTAAAASPATKAAGASAASGGKSATSPTKTSAGKASVKARVGSATSISVTIRGSRYVVTWSGKATSWSVILKVGSRTASAKAKGSVHSHLFVLPGAHGAVSARVKTP